MSQSIDPSPSGSKQNPTKGRIYKIVAVVFGVIWALVFIVIWQDSDGFTKGLVGAIGLFGVFGFMGLYNAGERHTAPSAEEVMQSDTRRPIVYLRSFDADDTPSNLEWAFADVVDDAGPFVAIGRPDDKVPPLGASRLYVADKDWKRKVIDLLDRAALVILLAGKTEGLHWELSQCGRRITPNRLVVLIPNGKEKYDALRDSAQQSGINVTLPPYPEKDAAKYRAGDITGLVHFDDQWQGKFVPFEKAFLKGHSHEWSSSSTRAQARLAIALQPVAARANLPIAPPPTNYLFIGLLTLFAIIVVSMAALIAAWYLGYLEPR